MTSICDAEKKPSWTYTGHHGGTTPPRNVTAIIVKNGVTKIKRYTFEDCNKILNIYLPQTLTKIGNYAFHCCASLITVNLTTSLTEIGGSAFAECTSLTTLHLPQTITKVEPLTFRFCTCLSSIILPKSLTMIGGGAFEGCSSLQSINLPPSLVYIGHQAFQYCTKLSIIEIPPSTNVESDSFSYCSTLYPPSLSHKNSNSNDSERCCWLKHRFDEMPLHRHCYSHRPTMQSINDCLKSPTPCTSDHSKDVMADSLGMTALHILIHNPRATSEMIKRLSNVLPPIVNSMKDIHGHTPFDIIISNPKPNFARVKDENDRLLLFCAVETGFKWSDKLQEIYRSYMPAITEIDPLTGLSLFMLAAIGPDSDLNTVYHLLLEYPVIIFHT